MARVISNPYARHTHSCGATVEFDLADICVNQKAETTAELRYVVSSLRKEVQRDSTPLAYSKDGQSEVSL